MLRQFANWIHEKERRFSRSFGTDISTRKGRRAAKWHFYMSDHGFLRGLWTNQEEIAPDVWRSNQPSSARIAKIADMGISTILNLRGVDKFSFYLFEQEACAAHDITLINHKIYARSLVPRAQFMALFDIFDRIEKPFLLHCKSGADRAGLASALWLLDKEGASLNHAKSMLSFKYMHLKRTKTGVLDHLLECYEADADMPIRQWFAQVYDPVEITTSFHKKMGWPPPESS